MMQIWIKKIILTRKWGGQGCGYDTVNHLKMNSVLYKTNYPLDMSANEEEGVNNNYLYLGADKSEFNYTLSIDKYGTI